MNTKTSDAKIPVIVIFAPTASGKTALTKELFSEGGSHFILNGEVISADSMQVYKYMNIGTAKPEKDFCSIIPHHLIDLLNPDQQFNVADFVNLADEKCQEIYSRNKIPVICGGTGFYIRSFLFGLPSTPESDPKIRAWLINRLEIEGKGNLHKELEALDPESAGKIHINDTYRVLRALEVYYTTGKTRSSYALDGKFREKYEIFFLVLEPDSKVLFERINKRVDLMFDSGLVEEFHGLLDLGYTKDMPGMKAIGYSEFFDGNSLCKDLDLVKENIKKNSCKYAKKQYTYIRDIKTGIRLDFDASSNSLQQVRLLIKEWYENVDK